MDKTLRQAPVADGKAVNVQVNKAVHGAMQVTPATKHPWRNMPIGKLKHDGKNVTQQQSVNRAQRTFLFDVDRNLV